MSIRTISPVDGRVYAERTAASPAAIDAALQRARAAQPAWRAAPLAARAAILERFCQEFERRATAITSGLTWQMGRPIRFAPSEVRGTLERARHMIGIAASALADLDPGAKAGFRRFIRREPLGVVFTVAAWNYPYLIAVNSVVPALMAGNAVLLKHSAQTPLCAEVFAECLSAAGLPAGLFQVLHLAHADTAAVIRDARVDFVAFTGSVAGGRAVQKVAAERFIGVGLELGGCDPVYVRGDADLSHAIENIVDGAYFNSGQSCCGLQRIYVHESVYEPFTRGCIELIRQYRLGDPTDPATTLGPLVRSAAADAVRAQVQAAVTAGARVCGQPRRHAVPRPAAAARCAARLRGHA
jgi:acyl-CoA reductase-like NAD-dependent aldehyde dehydrogenase